MVSSSSGDTGLGRASSGEVRRVGPITVAPAVGLPARLADDDLGLGAALALQAAEAPSLRAARMVTNESLVPSRRPARSRGVLGDRPVDAVIHGACCRRAVSTVLVGAPPRA